jgi:ankyrin repeat protein
LRQRDIIVDALLAAGADPNRDGYNYETPLITAVRLNNKTMVKALLAAKADPMISDSTGRDAFDWARQGRGQQILALLNEAAAR